jgi:predicted HTH transcriptional regulator
MINLCRDAGLPEPQFEQRVGSFVVTLLRDELTDRVMAELGREEGALFHFVRWVALSGYSGINVMNEITPLPRPLK